LPRLAGEDTLSTVVTIPRVDFNAAIRPHNEAEVPAHFCLPLFPRPLPKRCGRVTGPLRLPRRLCPRRQARETRIIMSTRPTERLVWALLATGLVCLIAWAITANVWWSLGALLIGMGLVITAVWSGS
jgi:hypothetical protein